MKKPKRPQKAIVDGDLLVYPAAASAQKTIYVAKDQEDNVIAEFESASEFKNWKESVEFLGMDMDHFYEGDLDDVVRDSYVRVDDFSVAKRNFKSMLKDWLYRAGVEDCEVYLSPQQGLENFRHTVSLRKVYKGNRGEQEKPEHLEELRKWAFKQPYVKRARTAGFETDDVVCGKGQKLGEKGVVIQNEKDGQQVVGCWIFYPDVHEEPIFSDPNSVGWLDDSGKKIVGCGWLWLLHQILTGDVADNYSGLDGCGDKKSFKTLSEYNNEPIEKLPDVVKDVIDLYRNKYGDHYQYVNKDGEEVVGSWFDFFEESVRLAYMVKNRKDYPDEIMDVAKEVVDEDNS